MQWWIIDVGFRMWISVVDFGCGFRWGMDFGSGGGDKIRSVLQYDKGCLSLFEGCPPLFKRVSGEDFFFREME